MKNIILLALIGSCLMSCTKSEIKFSDLAEPIDFSKTTVIANGSDVVTGVVTFNEDADISKISAKLTGSNITISGAENNEKTLSPVRTSEGKIEAEFSLTSTNTFGDASLELNVNEYKETYSFEVIKSTVNSISIEPSAFSMLNNFQSEITIEGLLLNEEGKKASRGVVVEILDKLSDGSPANGELRAKQLTSNGDSKISFIYSAGLIDPNQFVTIEAVVLDENGEPSNLNTSIEIFIRTE
ncbi:MAG: hypothetical protein AAFP76_09435 [Bacteroidota bacterium]